MRRQSMLIALGGVVFTVILGVGTAMAGTETAQRIYDTSSISIGSVTGGDGNQYSTIEWPGMSQTSEVGAPTLPVEYIRFLVPVYTNNFRVSVSNITSSASRRLPYDLYPAQEPVPISADSPIPFTSPNSEAYNVPYSIRAEVVDDGFIDGCNHIVTVAVYPMAYPIYLTISDLNGEKTWEISKGSLYIPRPSNDYCVSVWKTGFLPMIKLFAQKGSLTSLERKYIVNDCTLGDVENQNYTYSVSDNGKLTVRAKDRIDTYKGMTVNNGGTVYLECEKTVYLHGGLIRESGKLTIKAPDVIFGSDFTVDKGGILDIINK